MIEVIKSSVFAEWLDSLRDPRAVAKVRVRIDRAAFGNAGDVRPVGNGVSEMRIDYGPGYRVYFMQRGAVLIVLLCGGDKASQSRDIAKAKRLADEYKD